MTALQTAARRDGTIPQTDARKLLLAAIAGCGREPADSFTELRFRAGPGAPMRSCFLSTRDVASVGARVAALALEHDVFVGCAPRSRRFGGADAIERVWCLWADLDGPEAMERLADFEPWPSFVIRSGSPDSAHAWWPLNAPLRPDHAKTALRRLAHTLGADMAAAEPARILRLPGTLNLKHQPPVPVECVRLELDSYNARQIVGCLPDPPQQRAERSGPATPRPHSDDPLLSLPASEYVAALTGQPIGRDGKIACPFHDDSTPSLHVYEQPSRPGGVPGWKCYGCERSGSIIDFGAYLYRTIPRGPGYFEVRRRLAADLLPHVREAAA